MTLSLLLNREVATRGRLILSHPSPAGLESILSGLERQLGETERLVFPLPYETTRRHIVPPVLMRRRHADLWHALRAEEREATALVAGPTAAFLAPVVGEQATTIVAIPDPQGPGSAQAGFWRLVLGPFPELDEIPGELAVEADRDRWSELIGSAAGGLDLIRADDPASLARRVAAGLGLGQRAARRAARTTIAAMEHGSDDRPRAGSGQWIDEILYSFSVEPDGG
jgi:hypothetical protein